jgi:predicted phage-related endonuclease
VSTELERPAADLRALAADIEQLRALRAQLKLLGEHEDVVKGRILDALQAAGADTGQIGGATVVTWRETVATRLDQKRLKAAYPDIVAACTTQTTSRRFVLTEPTK